MEVIEAIKSRRSIRKYERKQVPRETMDELLEAARLAPSANNLQRWNIIVVTDDSLRESLVPLCGGQKFIGDCPALLVGVIPPGTYYSTVDVTIALDHLSLRAVELGLGTCWIGDFEAGKIAEKLGIPRGHQVAICMTLGYPANSPPARKRKASGDLFYSDLWGTPLK